MAPKALAPKALAPKALAAERPWEGSKSRLPEWGSVAGSPGRRAAEAAIHSPFQPEGEKLFWRGRQRETRNVRRSKWRREAPAAEPLGAWHA